MSRDIEQTLEHTVARSTLSSPQIQSLWKSDINWERAEKYVRRLQERIYQHTTNKHWQKVRNLQKLLGRSYFAKVVAIREVTQRNTGKNTPGIDGRTYSTSEERWSLTKEPFNYLTDKPMPLRRVFIPKQNGSQRPLSIPTIHDRIMQMIIKFVLEPEWEAKFETNSYGFRPGRRTMDAIDQIRNNIGRKFSTQWILDADISKCFDTISHQFLLNQIPTFTKIISKWLKAGVIEFGTYAETDKGTPQGGIISPLLANIALHGMENIFRYQNSIKLVRYADDFVVMANSKEILENYVIPKIKSFLEERNLNLNELKTTIIHRNEGFNFLGFEIRYLQKYNNQKSFLLIQPPKIKVSKVLQHIKAILKSINYKTLSEVIISLNWVIRGWCYYYQFSNAKQRFRYLQNGIFQIAWKALRRKHPTKGSNWIIKTYFKTEEKNRWILFDNNFKLFSPESVHVRRYIKVNEYYSPFDRSKREYWKSRLKANV